MRIRADFSERAVVRPGDVEWVSSPMPGVERQMLDRVGREVARATSIVRYAASSRFSEHEHGGGEEFLVLAGVFSDETGDFPAGTYVRNPIGTRHSPHSDPGCTIFVKLQQFAAADTEQKVIDTRAGEPVAASGDGRSVICLHEFGDERVLVERWAAGASCLGASYPLGQEVLVLDGEITDAEGSYPTGTWIRNPRGWSTDVSSAAGCTLWVKTGHL